jgi:hypothetical protein
MSKGSDTRVGGSADSVSPVERAEACGRAVGDGESARGGASPPGGRGPVQCLRCFRSAPYRATGDAWQDDGEARVDFTYDRRCGAPTREWARKTLHVGAGQWGQARYNGRFSDDWTSYWCYEKTVVNVGLSPAPSADVFIEREPDFRFSAMSDLL